MNNGMTIDEAIDRNTELKGELVKEGRLEKASGIQLGIDALKRIKYQRTIEYVHTPSLLPSESK